MVGAICPERSTGAAIIMPEVNVEAMNEHLAEISRRVSVGANIDVSTRLRRKALIIPSGLTAEQAASGDAELAIQQISELMLVPGVDIVGSIPLELQTPVVFSAGRLLSSTSHPQRADRLLQLLASPAIVTVLRNAGLERP